MDATVAAMTSAETVARTILAGFDKHFALFREITQGAKQRWLRGDLGAAGDAVRERLDMYDERVREAVAALDRELPAAERTEALFAEVKREYIGMLYEHKQPECAETFYNSVTTRLLSRRYHANRTIFTRPAIATEHIEGARPVYVSYYPKSIDLEGTFRRVLAGLDLGRPFQDLDRDVGYMLRAIGEHFPRGFSISPNFQVQVLVSPFYRGRAAYVVGRVLNGEAIVPFVVPLLIDARGEVYVDAMLLEAKDTGRLFSLARHYFMVDMEVPSATVAFLSTVVPSRSRAELYTLVGLQKQGKTLLFRDLVHHLAHSSDAFVVAPGTRGMVMLVFTLPSFPFVFKVIRDRFEPPKETDREAVKDRYRMVKRHDRAGRMIDSLEFVDLALPRSRMSEELVAEMQRIAKLSVEVGEAEVLFKHVYVERRLTPLDLAVSAADDARLEQAISEYGDAIKELARANIFPGDMLLKNFGVTRYGRVLFYDYDEIVPLTDCRFRSLPKDDDGMGAEPSFMVEPNDVFPEQFPLFLLPPGRPRQIFLRLHPDLADPRAWAAIQARLREGRASREDDTLPYPRRMSFNERYGGAAPESLRRS